MMSHHIGRSSNNNNNEGRAQMRLLSFRTELEEMALQEEAEKAKQQANILKSTKTNHPDRPLYVIPHRREKAKTEKKERKLMRTDQNSCNFNQFPIYRPPIERPKTSMQVARKFIGSSLGVQIAVDKETKEKEEALLNKAKERRESQLFYKGLLNLCRSLPVDQSH